MKHSELILPPLIVYAVVSIVLVIADYWNPLQVSHFLGLDLMYGLIPAIIYGIILLSLPDKRDNLNTESA